MKGDHFIMRILTRTQYEVICEIIIDQKKIIAKKEAEIERLKQQVQNLQWAAELEQRKDMYDMQKQNLSSMYGSTGQNIDYPNSHVHSENNSLNDKIF